MYKKPLDLYERLGAMRMSCTRRREAIADLQQAEAIVNLFFWAAKVLRRAVAGVAGVFGRRRNPSGKESYCG